MALFGCLSKVGLALAIATQEVILVRTTTLLSCYLSITCNNNQKSTVEFVYAMIKTLHNF